MQGEYERKGKNGEGKIKGNCRLMKGEYDVDSRGEGRGEWRKKRRFRTGKTDRKRRRFVKGEYDGGIKRAGGEGAAF